MISKSAPTKEQKQWAAESDAHTLVEADVIRSDPERLKAAQEIAKEILKEQEQKAEAMKAVAEGAFTYPKMTEKIKGEEGKK